MEPKVRIKTYSKAELAALYMPAAHPVTARRMLRTWIMGNESLRAALIKAGYKDRAVLLTPSQVGIVFKYLGEP